MTLIKERELNCEISKNRERLTAIFSPVPTTIFLSVIITIISLLFWFTCIHTSEERASSFYHPDTPCNPSHPPVNCARNHTTRKRKLYMLPLLKKWSDCMLRRHRLPLKMRRQLATTTYLVYICCHLWSIPLLNFSTASWTVEWSVFSYPTSKLVVDWLRSPFFHVHLNEWGVLFWPAYLFYTFDWDRFNQSEQDGGKWWLK